MRSTTGLGLVVFALAGAILAVSQVSSAIRPSQQPVAPSVAPISAPELFRSQHATTTRKKSLHLAECPGDMLCCAVTAGTHVCVENQDKCHNMGGAIDIQAWCSGG